MTRRKRTKKQLIHFITQYGIHIWAILIIANAALVYAYHFSTHAANKNDETLHTLDISQVPSTTVSPSAPSGNQPQASTAPVGPSINLIFTMPGIGSGGGVMKPTHLKRNLTIFLFSTDVNSLNPTVKPLYTIQGIASFDSNPTSPTYTSYIVPLLDLGSAVKDGDYQIAFRTDQSLRTLIKQNQTDLGGEIFALGKSSETVKIPSQTVLMGDTVPDQGDNKIDVSDYNAFINCYGSKNTSDFCQGKNYGDFNDDGVVDGIDYNILLRSLSVLAQEGVAVPKLSPTPASSSRVSRLISPTILVTPHKKPTITVKPSSAAKTSQAGKGGSIVGGLLFIFFLLILGAIGFVLYLKNEKVRGTIQSLIHLSPTGAPATKPTESTATEQPAPTEPAVQPGATAQTEAAAPAPEIKPETPPASTQPQTQPATGVAIEKECYVKTKGPDEAGTGMWLLLTDDNGPIQAHYAKNDAKDGFAKVKGVIKTENSKTFMEVSEITIEA